MITIKANKVKIVNALISAWGCAHQHGEAVEIVANGATEDEARRNIGSALMALGDGNWTDADISVRKVDTADDIFAEPADTSRAYAASIVVDVAL